MFTKWCICEMPHVVPCCVSNKVHIYIIIFIPTITVFEICTPLLVKNEAHVTLWSDVPP